MEGPFGCYTLECTVRIRRKIAGRTVEDVTLKPRTRAMIVTGKMSRMSG